MAKGVSKFPREELIGVARHLYHRGLVVAQAGNLSCRLTGDRILIDAHGASFGDLSEEDLLVIDLDGQVVEGPKEASSEWRMHSALYRARRDINAVIHTHPPYCSALAYLGKHLKPVNPEAVLVLGDVPIVAYREPGTPELAAAVVEQIGQGTAVLLEQHGAVAVAPNLKEAMFVSELLEEVAKATYLVDLLEGGR